MLNEDSSLALMVILQAAIVNGLLIGQMAASGGGDGFHPIDDLKAWWAKRKKDKAVKSIIDKLKEDPEVLAFLKMSNWAQRGKWYKLIEPKLNDEEKKYLKSISRTPFMNEERVYGMFNDSQGKPSKLSQEILDICLKALPKYVIDNIESVEAAGYSTSELLSPPTVSNKGQSRGVNEYTTIVLIFKNPMGRSKTTELMVGLRKRTSGPGTGYLAVKPTAKGHYVLPEHSAAIEFYDAAPERLAELYKNTLENLMK
jgi:hypothetical protein